MTERLLVRATEPGQLRSVDAVLHDARFSLADLRFDETSHLMTLAFAADLFDRRERAAGRAEDVPADVSGPMLLHVENVRSLAIEDPDGLVEHSFARLTLQGDRLLLLSNFPGRIELTISSLDLRVTRGPDPP